MEKVDYTGNVPQARFGHTITYISKGKAILFGGATGDTGRFQITGDTYSFDIQTRIWKKIETNGNQPSPRAAHAATGLEINQMVVYGGATGGGSLASDDLYLLDLRGMDDIGMWKVVPVVGQTPGRRYGHTVTYSKPFLVVFGGNTGQEAVNDCWFLNVEKSPFAWQKIEPKNESPRVRVYHSGTLCNQGSANGMVVMFGGRSNDQSALNDTWGLRRHRDGRWDWVKAPYRSERELPVGRYQHSSLFLGKLLLIIGGRTNNVGEQLGLEIYDTETSEWSRFNSIQRFRHGSWAVDNFIYVYGGFELESPNIPTDVIMKINLLKSISSNGDLLMKIINTLKQSSPNNSVINDISNQQKKTKTLKINKYKIKIHIYLLILFIQFINKYNQFFIDLAHQNQIIQIIRLQQLHLVIKQTQYQQIIRISHDPNSIHNIMIQHLLQPKSYINLPENAPFRFSSENIIQLCDMAEEIIKNQPIVLRVFIYQFLFRFGFSDECNQRLGEDPSDEDSVFNRVNRLFEYLPLATIIEDKIICLHGGIGGSLHYIQEIENLQRPLEVVHEVNTPEHQLIVDILWSDPTDSDQELGIQANVIRDPAGTGNIVKYGPDRVNQFLQNNGLSMILRAHECVMDGFERFAGGKLITVFSATDYCGRHKNAGAVLILKNNFEIIPKLIYPTSEAQHNWIEDEEQLKKRPPTPPRWKNNSIRKSFD
ncbi:ser thr protein phosphatase family protein, putative [Ichthyophthirius multifiliis]|uniref:Ser thr protein phosphatase family protein, putative n=1 Tax=Ichthyophthirius multifiliis TaxID=5932 RepID=G0R0Q8_ICHMU|nr:ser thr protein phosphatase family protein, putative [Ichthyophthirius multifiliis]EGR28942.1 ser thr protein phosphatase family protein, putative [Ichthyophthirius multifiliis]|eukprot:XP_004030178.1 ser thr protein phosphatase family protein, putative [Ichthyophthirius multifiliis]